MFLDLMTTERLAAGLASAGPWAPCPRIDERDAWQQMRDAEQLGLSIEAIMRYAEQVMVGEIDPLSGTLYMAFMRSGDRLTYEQSYFRRRAELSHLVIAECLSNEGRYFDRIIDYIWAILGEIYWCIPAHNYAGQHEMVMHKQPNPWKADDPLPVPDDEYLDLFNCETAALLAEACYLLGPELHKRVPSLYHLVHREIERRTLARLESGAQFGWDHGKNNWTPWCAHNLLLTAAYLIDDPDRLISIARRLAGPMQKFFDNIEQSGSCIEGPSYWVVSAGRLAAFIELVESLFGLRLGFESNQKFRAFGGHIVDLHIDQNKFVNFADGSLNVDLDHGLLAHYARMIDNQALTALLLQDMDRVARRKLDRPVSERHHNEYNRQVLVHLTRLLTWAPSSAGRADIEHDRCVWLDDMQVLVARQSKIGGEGLMLSAIAGSNDPEINHHSHNDVGHFSVCLNGAPMIIDLGQGAYSKSTFGEARYDMWHISSEGHNVPRINGRLQRPGTGAAARHVQFSHAKGVSLLRFDAAPSYFAAALGTEILRQISFEHDAVRINIEDCVLLPDGLSDFQLPLHVSGDCEVVEGPAGEIILCTEVGSLAISSHNLLFDGVQILAMNDPRHYEVWGAQIKRLCFKAENLEHGKFSLSIAPCNRKT